MLFSKLFGNKNKRDEHIEFQNSVKGLNPKSQLGDIQQCAQIYNNFFINDPPEKIITYPIKKDAIQFLQFLIPTAISVLEKNVECPELFTCLASISIFIQKDKDDVLNLYRLTVQILTSTNKSILNNSEQILQNFTINTLFCEKIISQNFFEIYQIGKSIGDTNSNLSFFLLRKCIEKTKSLPNQKIINEVKQHFSESSGEHLSLIAIIYQYSKTQPDFDTFNQQIKMINNCSCYEYLYLLNNSLAKNKILELLQDPNNELGTSLLQLYLKVPSLFPDSSNLIKFLRFVDSKSQLNFFQIIQKQSSEKLKETIEKFLPPWRNEIDGMVLFTILKNCFDSDHLVIILNQILTSPEKDNLKSAFSTIPNFSKLISSLFECILEPDQFQIEFSHLIQLIIDGLSESIECLFYICASNDPINYFNALKSLFSQLIQVPEFVSRLPELSDNELLQHYLLTPEIIYPSVEKGLSDFIASLSKSGPHEIIDKIIVEKFDSSELKNLDQNDLTKLSKGLLKNEPQNLGSVKIPSLIPKISHFTFSSLSDRYVVGKYLLEKKLINNESELIPTIGIQFLTSEVAHSVIEKPRVLFDLTNTTYPHSSVYQFEQNEPESYFLIIDSKFKFEFRVDQYEQEFTVLEAANSALKFKNNALFVDDMKFPCILKKWHTITINSNANSSLHINIDSSYNININQEGPITIGSRTNPPGSTFYVKSPVNYRGQIGKSVIFVDYKGFAYHSPRINAIPKIFSKLIETENKDDFALYINSLLNIQSILCDSIDVSVLLGLLRQVLVIKHDLVTEEVVQVILGLISINGTIDWTLFKCIFVDYNLWLKLHNVLLSPICSILQTILSVQPLDQSVVQSLSLFHFFLDLSLFLNINSEPINKIVFLLSQYEEDKMSAFTIHLLKENVPQSISFLMENEDSIIDTIPIKFIPFTKPKVSLHILRMYSVKCLSSDSILNFDELEKLIPYFETLITIKDFWCLLLTIACKVSFQDIQSFRGNELKVPQMVNIIFNLLCKFYKRDFEGNRDEEIFFETLSDVICSIMLNTNNVNFYPYISSFQELAHFGLTITNVILDPILFDSFEPCRLPIDSNNNNRNERVAERTQETYTEANPFYYKSGQFLQGKDLWFGLKGDNFPKICDDITKRKLLYNISRTQVQMSRTNQAEPSSMKIDKNVIFYENVIKIITNFLLQMNSDNLIISLQNILLFGSNVDPQITIKVHQTVLFLYLRRSKPTQEFLVFLKRMIIAGWWETQLDQLFSAICIVSLRVEENDSKTWMAISDVLKTILSLTSDYTKIQFKLYSNSVFHKSIVCDLSNLMFYFHILLSDSFLSSPRDYIQEIWYDFLFSLGSTSNHAELSNLIFGETTNSQETPIFQRINEIANSTSFFTEISPNDEPFCTLLKNKAKEYYESFIHSQKESMNLIYENIRSIRSSNKSFACSSSSINQASFLYNPDFIEEVANEIEKFAFMVRFNILSSRDEIDSFKLWSILPMKTTNQYQVTSSVHPISVPTLLVPFFTTVDLDDYKSYEKIRVIKMKLDENDPSSLELPKVEIPHCVDSYVSQAFFNISWKLNNQLFISSFPFYGKINDIDSIIIVSGLSEIPSVLVSCERGFFIIIDSSINETEDDKHIFLHNQPLPLKIHTFIDNCACNFYGKTSLFCGHIVLQFQVKDIFVAAPRDYLQMRIACEIWFILGYSLFIKFIDKITCERFMTKCSAQQVFIPSSESFFSSSFARHLCRSFSTKKKKLSEVVEAYQKDWMTSKMPSYIYLLVINFFASRSFSCAFQYPVMPWPIKQRVLSKPMGQQTAERGLRFARNLTILQDDFMYKELYSNPSIVLHFMQRIQPFTNALIETNGGLFDDRNKLFKSVDFEYKEASEESKSNVQELIPEFFIFPEVFANPNSVSLLNASADDSSESDFSFPGGISSPFCLSSSLKNLLNTREEIEKWIDLTFGAKMAGQSALESLNVFSPIASRKMTQDVASEGDLEERMIECGVLPTQVFVGEHPRKEQGIVRSGRKTLVSGEEPIFEQLLNVKCCIEKVDDLYVEEGALEMASVASLFMALLDRKVVIYDGLFSWSLHIANESSFSSNSKMSNLALGPTVMAIRLAFDKSMAALAIENGALAIYRCLAGKNKKNVTSLDHLTTCFPPNEHINEFLERPFTRCAISPHLNLAVETARRSVFCFHISSSRFIRKIDLAHDLVDVHVCDSHELIVGVGARSIEIVTINGTNIASIEIESNSNEIVTASSIIENEPDDELLLATGTSKGSIKMWSFDAERAEIKLAASAALGGEVRALKLLKKGGALLAVEANGRSKLFVNSLGVSGPLLKPSIVAGCARCGQSARQYFECSMCKLFYCQSCVDVTGSVAICKRCLERVIKNAAIDTM